MIRTFSVLCILPLTAGCGILAVPHRVGLPEDYMQMVRVSDRDSGEPLPSAQVSFHMSKYVNWMKPMPRTTWGPYRPANDPGREPDTTTAWRAMPLGDGVFRIKPKHRIGWTQVWFPLAAPLGGVLYRTYHGRVVVQVPGYDGIWVASSASQTRESALQPRMYADRPFHLEEDRVHIMLRKNEPLHNNSVENIGAIRAESSH